MDKLLAHARTTLEEEERLIEELKELSGQIRSAILNHSVHELNMLNAKQDNAIIRLDITRQSQLRLLKSDSQNGGKHPESLQELFEHMGSTEDLERIKKLQKSINRLRKLNRENSMLLEKQLSSIRAFGQVVDLVQGIEKVYERDGSLRKLDRPIKIEETR